MNKILCSFLLLLLACTASAQERLVDFDMAKIARFGFGNILTGAWIPQEGWVAAEDLQGSERFHFVRLWGGEACRLVGQNGTKEAEAVISAIHSEHPGEFKGAKPGVRSFDTHSHSSSIHEPSGLLTIACPWEVQPRLPLPLSLNSQIYRDIVKRFLASQGLDVEKPELAQLFKIDLEGDGVDEVLICAQNIAAEGEACFEADQPLAKGTGLPGAAQPGAYSVLLLRKLAEGKVLELPLHVFVSPKGSAPTDGDWTPPVVGRFYQTADLNGDGVLEIIAGTAFYEGYDYRVFEVKGGRVREVLSCGAGI
ncbi:MAG: hypothetical protein IKY97_08115 [Mailhella sp.]|nr:hypothetical protein [Mailhella sp.]